MLKKSLLANVKAFKVSIGTQTHCTVSSNKAFASPGEIVTISVSYPTGYSNATVSVSPSVTVNKKNSSTYTFVMPSSDVTVTASASVLSFSIYVNKSGSGTVNVKSVANYGERVTVTLSPGQNYELGSVSASGASLSGSGNTRTFTMPANSVTINVQFTEIECWVTIARGWQYDDNFVGYSVGNLGSINRIPYWNNNTSSYLRILGLAMRTYSDGDTIYITYGLLNNSKYGASDAEVVPYTLHFTDGGTYSLTTDEGRDTYRALNSRVGQRAKVVFNKAPSGYL